jgi:hypothetical protein
MALLGLLRRNESVFYPFLSACTCRSSAHCRRSLPTLTGDGGEVSEGSEGGQPLLSNKKCNRNDIIL